MGDWAQLLQVIDRENREMAAPIQASPAADEPMDDDAGPAPADDSRLFVKAEQWDGPSYLRYSSTGLLPSAWIPMTQSRTVSGKMRVSHVVATR